jgi:hypothetical protein
VSDDIGYHFQFPGASILRSRGKILSTVILPSKSIPPTFAFGEPFCFLPCQEWEKNASEPKSLSLELVQSLMAWEDRSMRVWTQGNFTKSEDTADCLQTSMQILIIYTSLLYILCRTCMDILAVPF